MRWLILFTPGLLASAVALGEVNLEPSHAPKERDLLQVAVELLPGEPIKAFDPTTQRSVPAVLFGSAELDVAQIQPLSLRMGGSAVTKDANGALSTLVDFNADGFPDLRFELSTAHLQADVEPTELLLTGRMVDGRRLWGAATIRRSATDGRDSDHDLAAGSTPKQAPLRVVFDVTPGDALNRVDLAEPTLPIAILGGASFDPRRLIAASVLFSGAPLLPFDDGELAHPEDVNGDGYLDLLVRIKPSRLQLGPGGSEIRMVGRTIDDHWVTGASRVQQRMLQATTFSSRQEPRPSTRTVQSTASIVINDLAVATPYPSTIEVSGLSGVVSKVWVTLHGVTHTWPQDIDVLLVAPNGDSVELMSDAGGQSPGINDVSFAFDDDAREFIDYSSNPVSGSYRTTEHIPVDDAYPAPAPDPRSYPVLSTFNGIDPNGTWSLFVVDDTAGDSGAITRGWSIQFLLAQQVCNPAAIEIRDFAVAMPYPSIISVNGVGSAGQWSPTQILTVTLKGLTHTRPQDIDILLVSPEGLTAVLMSDAGGSTPVADVDLVIDEFAFTGIPTPIQPGTFTPTDVDFGPDDYPLAPPISTYESLFFSGDPDGPWSLFVVDDGLNDVGEISGGWCLNFTYTSDDAFGNPESVSIPGSAPGITSGPAGPYPSTIEVSGVPGDTAFIIVTLDGLTHSYPDDLDILLSGPSFTAELMSDAGGAVPVSDATLRFAWQGGDLIPDDGPLTSGDFRVSTYEPGDVYPAPAPAPTVGGYGVGSLHPLPNGDWNLWIVDDESGDYGSLERGWSVTVFNDVNWQYFQIDAPVAIPASGPADVYPIELSVPEGVGPIAHLQVSLALTHTYPDDLDIILVAPGGESSVLVSDSGGDTDFDWGLELLDPGTPFLPTAPAPVPDADPWASGVFYSPADYEPGDVLPAPAPAPPHTVDLGSFLNINPRGTWRLFVYDDTAPDSGVLSNFSLSFVPLYPVGGVNGLRWTSTDEMTWSYAPRATYHSVYRGASAQLEALLDSGHDSCTLGETTENRFIDPSATPPSGQFSWYLVRGISEAGEGAAGFALTEAGQLGRLQSSTGTCP